MVIEYFLTKRDLVYCTIGRLFRNRLLWLIVAAGIVVNVPALLRGAAVAEVNFGAKAIGLLLFALGFASLVYGVTIALLILAMFLKKNRGILGRHKISFTENGLIESTEVNESLFRWTGFHKFQIGFKNLYLFVTDNQYFVVPKRFFRSPQEIESLRQQILDYVQKSKGDAVNERQ